MIDLLFGFLLEATSNELFIGLVGGVIATVAMQAFLASGSPKHADYTPNAEHGTQCPDHRLKSKYKLAGGVGTYTAGAVPWLLYSFVFPGFELLRWLALIHFFMSAFDILYYWFQLFTHWGPEVEVLRSHGIGLSGAPGCFRTSGWDPIALTLFFIQKKTGADGWAYVRGLYQFLVYDLLGWAIALPVNFVVGLFAGKLILASPL